MTFDEFAAKVAEIAGGVPCGATHWKGFNGLPDRWIAYIESAAPGSGTHTESYPEPEPALVEFAGVVEVVRLCHEEWLLRQRIGKPEHRVAELGNEEPA